ncbi:MAG TPA: YibE/F family protein, partial [Candidatus Gracilibacteria bacterium]|nr:YibE/F family protein [Candidatus Gracilibacteria bacterium]
MKKIFIGFYFSFIIATLLFILFIPQPQSKTLFAEDKNYDSELLQGTITGNLPEISNPEQKYYELKVKSGTEKSKTIKVYLSDINNFNHFKIGDEVQIYKFMNNEDQSINYEIADFHHTRGLIWGLVLFGIITFLVARRKGLTAILSIGISLSLFYLIFIRMLLLDSSPVLACLLFVFSVSLITTPLIHGFNRKSLSAICSIVIGIIFSLGISYFFHRLVQLGNTPDEDFRNLIAMFPQVKISEILITSLFLGAI